MIMLKKIILLILSFSILCTCFIFTASATFSDSVKYLAVSNAAYWDSFYDDFWSLSNLSWFTSDDFSISDWWSALISSDDIPASYDAAVEDIYDTYGQNYITSDSFSRYLTCTSHGYSASGLGNLSRTSSNSGWYTTYVSPTGATVVKLSSNLIYFNNMSYSSTFTVSENGTYTLYYPDFCLVSSCVGSSSKSYARLELQYYNGSSWVSSCTTSCTSYSSYTSRSDGLYDLYFSGRFVTGLSLSAGVSYRLYCLFYNYFEPLNVGAYMNYPLSSGFYSSCPYIMCTSTSSVYIDPSTRISDFNNSISEYNTYVTNNYNNYNTGDTIYNYYIGTTDSSGNVNQVYDPDIYSEDTLIFTEPVTGDQIQTTGWKYYYLSSCRGYFLTLADGTYYYQANEDDELQEITYILLAYADDALYIAGFTQDLGEYSSSEEALANAAFIDEYAYVIAETSVENGGTSQDSCSHVYTSETITSATCTEPGIRRYTCELCGFTQDVKIPALGHDYELTNTVATVIDGDGNITTHGYSEYTCSLCGESYKVYDSIDIEDGDSSEDAHTHDWLATEVVDTTYSFPSGEHCPSCDGEAFTYELDASSETYTVTCSDCGTTWTVDAEVTYGYTTYTCSICGASYTESDNPNDSSGFFSAIGNFISNGITWIADKLSSLIDSISGITATFGDYAAQILESVSSFPDLLSELFSFIPGELMAVFWFSVVAVVVVLVWKKFFSS